MSTTLEELERPEPEPKPPERCPQCDEVRDDLRYGPDPYQHEINDNDTPVWLCPDCYQDNADAI